MTTHLRFGGLRFWMLALATGAVATVLAAGPTPPDTEQWRVNLVQDWRGLPEPPITPYRGPFGGEARGFVGRFRVHAIDPNPTIWQPWG